MRPALFLALTLGVVATGCSSPPPKPPEADESTRRPVNAATAVELQVCRSNLQNTRILAGEAARQHQVLQAYAALAAATAERNALKPMSGSASDGNLVYALRFGFGSSRLDLPGDAAQRIVDAAREAPLVVLRGRTDGQRETPAETRAARDRTLAVQAWLVRSGVDPSRIRATWQPVGDHVADNAGEAGRALNRRVEIEIYRTAPRFVVAAGSPGLP